jgi:hypothetical protein
MPINRNDTQYLLKDVLRFSAALSGVCLRRYQEEIATAVVDSVIDKKGLSFVVMLPRQSGKNEVQAQIEAYLLTLFMNMDYEIVKVSPTWKPQSANAMRRLERTFSRNLALKDRWIKESGYIYRVNQTRILFLSASPTANVVGATASLLLECDEAQDVEIAKWDRDIAPMAASTNATRVFYGTAWTSKSLLARELRAARAAQELDGIQRVFIRNGYEVGKEVPAYMKHVEEQIARLGRQHPMVKTQYFSEEIDAEGGMFSPERRLLMRGDHRPLSEPYPVIARSLPRGTRGQATKQSPIYVFTFDVAGEDEGATHDLERLDNPRRDATA